MIISGLRTSCAMTVDSRPSDDSRSFCDISRWNRAIESVSVLNVVASSRASSSSQRLPWRERDLARQVAGGGHLAHHVGDRGQRPRDRARDGEAEERREQHRDDGGDGEPGVDRLRGLAAARCATAGSARPARPPAAASSVAVDSGRGSATYSSPPSVHARDAASCAARPPSAAYDRRGSVAARICPSMPNAMSLPVISFSCAASASSSRKPTLSVPRISGAARPIVIGTVTSCRMPSGCGSRLTLSCPPSASRTAGWLATIAAARGDRARRVASTSPVLLVTSSRFDVELVLVVARRCPAPSADRWCRPRPSACGRSAMSRAISVNVCVRVVAQLIDQRAGRADLALQRRARPPASRAR